MANKKSKLSKTDSSENPAEVQLKQEQSGNGYHSIIADDLKLLHELKVLQHETELQNEELRSDQVRFELLSSKYNEFFEFAPYGYFILNPKGFIGEVNLTGATLLGRNRNDIVNKEFFKFLPTSDQEIFQNKLADLIKTQIRQVCEIMMFSPDGKRLYFRLALSVTIHLDEFEILLAATDITLEKQIEDTQSFLLGCNWAKLGKDFFEYLAEYLANTLGMDYVCIDRLLDNGLEAETVAIYFDGQYEDNVTYALKDTPCGDVVGHNVCCFPKNVRNLFPRDIVLQEMRAESYLGVTLWGADGRPVGLIAVIGRKPLVDLMQAELVLKQVAIRAASELEHRQVEEELKKKDERLHAILASAMDGFWLTDAEGRFMEVNESYCRMSGYTSEELLRMKISDLECIETSEETESHIRKIFENGDDRFESIHRRKDGSVFNVEVSVQYRSVEGGQFVTFLHDITKRKQSEEITQNLLQIVQQERDKLSSLINNMTDEVWFADANKKITLVNTSVLNEFGDHLINTFEIDKFVGSLDIFRPDGSPLPVEESPTLRALKGEVVKNYEEIIRIPSNNQMRYREKNSSPVKDDNGNILGAVTVIRDITERKLAEIRIRQQNAVLEGINRILSAALTCETPEHFGTACLEIAEEITGSKFGFIGEINEQGLHDIAISNPGWDECKIIDEGGHRKPAGNFKIHGLYGHVIQSGKSLFTNTPSAHPHSIGMPAGHPPLESFLGVPLIHEGRAVGIIALGNRPNGYTLLEQESLEKIAPVISEAIHRKKAEMAFMESEKRFSKAFHYSPMGINIFRLSDGRSVNVNEAFIMLTGYSREELIGHSANELNLLVNSNDRHDWLKVLNEGDAVQSLEISIRQKSGQIVYALFSISKIEVDGEAMGLIQAFDITERKKAEEKIRKSEERHRLLSETMLQGVVHQDSTGKIISMNPAAERILGKTKESFLGSSSVEEEHDTIHEDGSLFHGEEHPAMATLRTGQQLQNVVMGVFNPTMNEYRWISIDSAPLFRESEKVPYEVYTVFEDITERKRSEEALVLAKEDWERTFNAIPDLIAIIDHDHRIVRANQAMYDRMKMRNNQCIGTHCYELMHKTDEPPAFCPHSKLLVDGQMHEAEFFEHHLDGDFLVTTTPLFNSQGQVIASVHVARDITERKKAEDALRKSEEKLQTLYSSMSEGVAIHDIVYENDKAVDYIIADINPAFEKLTGLERSKTIGKKATGLYGTGEAPYLDIYSKVADGEPSEFFEVYFPPMEKHFSISVFSPGKGKFATVFNDITERKKKEETLHKLNQTLAALGKSSQAMIYSEDEAKYMRHVCDIIVNDCGFAMVWIGVAEYDETKSVRPVACSGFEEGYLDTLNVSWAEDSERGRGPTGTAIRTGTISMCWDMHNDPNFEPWRAEALKRGYASSIVFPLMSGDKAFGAITIYSKKAEQFEKDEIKLLSELASDLSHGITSIRLRAAHKLAEEQLFKSHSKLEMLVKERTRELQITNEMLHNEIKIRVKQEQSLILAEEKYRTVADFTYNWETWIDPYGKFIYVSPSCHTITGHTVEEFMDDPNLITKIAHPDDREMVEKHYHEEHQPAISNWSVDFRIIARNGTERWIGHSCRPVFSSEGKWLGQRGSNRDITEQKKAEKVLVDSKNHLRELTQRMDAVAEEERIRISREIHDELGHLLTALKFDIEDLGSKTDLSIELIKIELEGMVSMVEALIDSVRKIATDLRPGILDHLGLFPAIEWKIKEFRLRNKICCEYSIDEMDVNFDKNETTIIYRILQEIFTNVVRHSKADKIWLAINKKDGLFILSVTDDGVGFKIDDSNHFGSLGLMGMRERALSIGGEIQMESAPGKGTTVRFLLKKD